MLFNDGKVFAFIKVYDLVSGCVSIYYAVRGGICGGVRCCYIKVRIELKKKIKLKDMFVVPPIVCANAGFEENNLYKSVGNAYRRWKVG